MIEGPLSANVNPEQRAESLRTVLYLQKFQPLLEPVAKAILALSVFLYCIGLFISNVYFQQFGLATFDLLRAQYVLVGLLWLVLVSLSFILTAAVFDEVQVLVKTWRSESGTRSVTLWRVFRDLFGIGTTLFIGRNLIAQLGARDISGSQWFFLVFIVESNFLCIMMLVSAISHALRGAKSPAPQLGRPIYIVSICGIVLAMLVGYSLVVFPLFDQSFGGGRLHRIELMLKSDKIRALQEFGLDVSSGGKLGPVFLISESTDGFLITTSQSPSEQHKAYRVSRDSVEASRYTK